ncbi:DMT family transporter [Terasakiella pusilla]|uniref:DMT family transporter n=1 Tax=Terasakiella pusilla TaxID=64973 RepID=UPI00068F0CB0|nr:DMT family transporter [Terasakiella pusilla]
MTTSAITYKSYGSLILLAMMWGSSFSVIKVALESIAPLSIAAGRIGLAAVIILSIAIARREVFPREKSVWGCLIALGILGTATPFFLISWSENTVDSGMAAVLMSVVPLTLPVMAHFITDDEKLTPYMVAGVLTGFCGLLVLVGPSVLQGLGDNLLAQGGIVAAALSYGSASLVARKLKHLPFMVVAAGSLSIATLIMVPAALIFDQPWTFSPDSLHVLGIIYLGIVPTAAANVLLLRIIKSNGVSFLALNNYLVPVFGVLFGAISLGEAIPPTMLAGMGIIFVGIFISNLKRKSG